jgi:hypothetical protein
LFSVEDEFVKEEIVQHEAEQQATSDPESISDHEVAQDLTIPKDEAQECSLPTEVIHPVPSSSNLTPQQSSTGTRLKIIPVKHRTSQQSPKIPKSVKRVVFEFTVYYNHFMEKSFDIKTMAGPKMIFNFHKLITYFDESHLTGPSFRHWLIETAKVGAVNLYPNEVLRDKGILFSMDNAAIGIAPTAPNGCASTLSFFYDLSKVRPHYNYSSNGRDLILQYTVRFDLNILTFQPKAKSLRPPPGEKPQSKECSPKHARWINMLRNLAVKVKLDGVSIHLRQIVDLFRDIEDEDTYHQLTYKEDLVSVHVRRSEHNPPEPRHTRERPESRLPDSDPRPVPAPATQQRLFPWYATPETQTSFTDDVNRVLSEPAQAVEQQLQLPPPPPLPSLPPQPPQPVQLTSQTTMTPVAPQTTFTPVDAPNQLNSFQQMLQQHQQQWVWNNVQQYAQQPFNYDAPPVIHIPEFNPQAYQNSTAQFFQPQQNFQPQQSTSFNLPLFTPQNPYQQPPVPPSPLKRTETGKEFKRPVAEYRQAQFYKRTTGKPEKSKKGGK